MIKIGHRWVDPAAITHVVPNGATSRVHFTSGNWADVDAKCKEVAELVNGALGLTPDGHWHQVGI